MRRHSLGDHNEFGAQDVNNSELGRLRAHGSRFILTIWASRGMTLTTTEMMKDAKNNEGGWRTRLSEIFANNKEKKLQIPISAGADEKDK